MSNLIAKILSTEIIKGRLFAKILALGNKDVKRVNNISPFGLESNIPKGYKGIYAETGSKEDKILIGIINKEVLTAVGETRLFSTDKAGKKVFSIHLRNNGTAEIGGTADNMARFSKLKEGFDDFVDDFNDFVSDFNQHTHVSAAPGSPTGTPGASVPPIVVPPTAAEINGAKIDEIKTT